MRGGGKGGGGSFQYACLANIICIERLWMEFCVTVICMHLHKINPFPIATEVVSDAENKSTTRSKASKQSKYRRRCMLGKSMAPERGCQPLGQTPGHLWRNSFPQNHEANIHINTQYCLTTTDFTIQNWFLGICAAFIQLANAEVCWIILWVMLFLPESVLVLIYDKEPIIIQHKLKQVEFWGGWNKFPTGRAQKTLQI